VRAALGWDDTQLKVQLARLLEMKYLLLHRRGLTYEYGLLWDGDNSDQPHLCGLLDVGDVNWSGLEDKQSASGRVMVGNQSEDKKGALEQAAQGMAAKAVGVIANAVIKEKIKTAPVAAALNGSLHHG